MSPPHTQHTQHAADSRLGFEHVFERGSSARTLLLLHSTGGDERQLVGLGRQLAPDANLLSPRGKVLEHGVTRRFFARTGIHDLDIPDLKARTDELADFVAEAVDAYGLDADKLTALGYSNGANIAVGMLLRRPQLLAGAALLRPTLPYEPEQPPPLLHKRVLVASGSRDGYVAPGASDRLVALLRAGGAEVTYELAPVGHELLQSDLDATARWLAATG